MGEANYFEVMRPALSLCDPSCGLFQSLYVGAGQVDRHGAVGENEMLKQLHQSAS